MDHSRRPHLLSISTPARPVSTSPTQHTPSQSPFRYVHFPQVTEKDTPLADIAPQRLPSSSRYPASPRRSTPSCTIVVTGTSQQPPILILAPVFAPPWLADSQSPPPLDPLSSYTPSAASVFVVAIAFYKTQVFAFLDDLSVWLRTDELFGYAVLFVLIFLTTFPPIPMYSTLIILSGYTFGPWAGATLSYFAALSGALTVFIISRTLLRDCISRWLESACTIKRVVRAVEKRPKLLFLTYTVCTAASLFKVIIHTSLGASIHSFKNYNSAQPGPNDDEEAGGADAVARMWTIGGVILCIAIFVYLSVVARRAVDDELGDDPDCSDPEETAGFLANADPESGSARQMVQLR
ncbi:hypothetical protein DFH06DRAFT_1322402 [Mycena polygramma]|nr:hypothetical protein DFH06DRAFT_1322402 [Mycena polygramma]